VVPQPCDSENPFRFEAAASPKLDLNSIAATYPFGFEFNLLVAQQPISIWSTSSGSAEAQLQSPISI
jgi:hypothetical protein